MWLSIEEFEAVSGDYDQAVLHTPGILQFCSSSAWILSAWHALEEQAQPCIMREGDNWIILSLGNFLNIKRVLHPLEASWLFACPIIGVDRVAGFALFRRLLKAIRSTVQVVLLGAIPEGGAIHGMLRLNAGIFQHVQSFEGSHCLIASLKNGEDGFLSRRSARFRSNLRKQEQRTKEVGVQFSYYPEIELGRVDELLQRMVAVERKSWKAKADEGVFHHADHIRFYRELMRRTARKGTLRVVMATDAAGEDAAFIFGACFGNMYRGFQMSYDKAFSAIGLGNVCQWAMIEKLCAEGIETYDLGMSIDYKRRWAENEIRLINFFAVPMG